MHNVPWALAVLAALMLYFTYEWSEDTGWQGVAVVFYEMLIIYPCLVFDDSGTRWILMSLVGGGAMLAKRQIAKLRPRYQKWQQKRTKSWVHPPHEKI